MAATSYKVIGEDLPGKITFAKEPEGSERRNFAALLGDVHCRHKGLHECRL